MAKPRQKRSHAAKVLGALAWLLIWGILSMNDRSDAQTAEALDFDKRWDYNHPDSTEAVFRSLLPGARASGDADHLAQLLTQIARAQGLQRKFDEAHATLDEVEAMLTGDLEVAKVRYLLERGRVFNSSKQADKARPLFLEAWDLARSTGADFYAVDAAHMMGIIETGDESLAWNRKAIAAAEASESERARNWLGSLYNNTGWTYHDQGDYEAALDLFEKALRLRKEKKQEAEIRIARWCVARTLRSLGRVDEALSMQQELAKELEAIGETDGYVQEELGECLLLVDRKDEATQHFARAYEILSKDSWLAAEEPERIARLKELGQVGSP
jgi:tetratricopeptide (TPR) repeat protein